MRTLTCTLTTATNNITYTLFFLKQNNVTLILPTTDAIGKTENNHTLATKLCSFNYSVIPLNYMVTTCNIVPPVMHTMDELQNQSPIDPKTWVIAHLLPPKPHSGWDIITTTKSTNKQPKLCPSSAHFPQPTVNASTCPIDRTYTMGIKLNTHQHTGSPKSIVESRLNLQATASKQRSTNQSAIVRTTVPNPARKF